MPANSLKAPFQYERIPVHARGEVKKKRAENMPKTLKRIWGYLAREKGKLALVAATVVLTSGLGLLGPFLVGTAIDRYMVAGDAEGLAPFLLGLVSVFLFHSLFLFLQNYWMIEISQNTVKDLREDLFQKFHRLPISYFDKRQHGELMSRLTNDIDNVNMVLNSSVIQILSSVLTLAGTVVVMVLLSPVLTAVALSVVPLMYLGIRWITNRTGPLYKVQQRELGQVNGFVEEILSGQHVVKTYSLENLVIRQFEEKNESLKLSGFWAQTIAGFTPKVMNTLNFLSFGMIAFIGGFLAIRTDLATVGMIVIFTEYARQFTRPLNDLSNQFNLLLSAVAGAERVFQVLDEPEEETDEENAVEPPAIRGHVKFEKVTFSYGDGPVLKDISFEAKPGETVALVGHTGAGKTTIIHLLSRFYDCDGGKITVDGRDIRSVKRSSLREHMAFVPQDTFLFRGTVKENIRYGRLDATDEEVVQAAKDANAHDFIMKLPMGYDTMMDENGSGISQGQRQLLSIARALLRKPAIYILDEATSNIDTVTELKIQDALKRLMEGRTGFVIAHRLNTVRNADKILVLDHGKIVEAGNHEELLRKKGHYYRLYQTQFMEGKTL
ncbi:ABC transporter ATP-binding protein [Caldibacillus debilis]|uniref:ABC transporter ATP-binding protein n=1 Tax=Caldibacillus debilis TaxID=301148 RepID=UPI002FD8D0F0